ncbi:fatty-acid-binding protein 3, chloroplastic isoform X2 [Cynara cardunculus var. scolymus]|uniref:fatty-acid-binding protein 3, chloroplastic isoform X2 n=1 Tax=Cynara cardunculus var. scolymus TaxID=59895 RepID=UPI000D627338|nr:fatty-acid-binding protein 3, chloroplastic isoform X2 [Cynara cardunculus var. scolymus]
MVGGGGIGIGATPRSVSLLPHNRFRPPNSNPIPRNRTHFLERNRIPPTKLSVHKFSPIRIPSFSIKATASSGNTEYVEEPATNVKFQSSLSLPGCPSSLSLIGTGFREKVFAIIGVKVYAAGLYLNPSILDKLEAWKGRNAAEIQEDSSLFNLIYQDPLEKSLQIVLVRDVDGKTFWDALDEAISPRIKSPQVDETALSTFRGIFQNRPLKKGTSIFLTWLHPSKMLVHLSAEGIPSAADATIQSENVTISLFDVFFGRGPVSPSLKASVSNCLASILR